MVNNENENILDITPNIQPIKQCGTEGFVIHKIPLKNERS